MHSDRALSTACCTLSRYHLCARCVRTVDYAAPINITIAIGNLIATYYLKLLLLYLLLGPSEGTQTKDNLHADKFASIPTCSLDLLYMCRSSNYVRGGTALL